MSLPPLQHDTQAVRGFIRFARLAGATMVVVGAAVWLGWRWHLPLLTAVIPGQQTMKELMAIGFVLSGLSLIASLRREAYAPQVSQLLSLLVLVLGAVDMSQHLWQVLQGHDPLFATLRADHQPMREVAPSSAVAFALLGVLGLGISSRRWLWLREMVAVCLLSIAMFGLAAYGFALAGQASSAFTPLPIHTGVLLLVATLGWMSSRPTLGLTRVATADSVGGAFARRLLLPSLLLPVLFTFVCKALQSMLGTSEVFALSLAALFSGGSMAWMVWWVATLLERMDRQRREAERLRDDASTDALTGLANRRAFDAALNRLLVGRRDNDVCFCLLMLDLDKFKNYNDDFGHLAGDDALRVTGRLLRARLRPTDLPARYGGEEFALLLPGICLSDARRVAERIIADFRAFDWPQRVVSISIGIAEAQPDDSVLELVHRADAALYDAKRAGRDRAVVATAL